MENKAHALAAGAFVLGLTALLVALTAWLMRDTEVHNLYELSTRESVSGLQPQAVVRYRGIAVGRVTDIDFDPAARGNVRVRISLDGDTPVTRSTYATLGYQGVTGLAYVQLDDDGSAPQPLPPDAVSPPRIPLRPSLLSKLGDRGEAILMQAEQTTQRLNQLLAPENQKLLMQALGRIGDAAGGVDQLTRRLDATVTQRLDPALAAALPALQDTSRAMKGMDKAAEEVTASAAEMRRTAERLNVNDGPIDRLAEGAQATAHAADSFNTATLPRVNRVTEEASRAARQLSRAANAISDNPQSLLFGHGDVPPGPGEPGFRAPAPAR
jgi:phospholipid/cholesterol/gamma-HCH transport system substrate-binding protein